MQKIKWSYFLLQSFTYKIIKTAVYMRKFWYKMLKKYFNMDRVDFETQFWYQNELLVLRIWLPLKTRSLSWTTTKKWKQQPGVLSHIDCSGYFIAILGCHTLCIPVAFISHEWGISFIVFLDSSWSFMKNWEGFRVSPIFST